MISLTREALDAIKTVTDADEGGLRISAGSSASMDGHGPALTLEPVRAPDPDSAVIDAEGTHVYLDAPAARLLDGKVLDAEPEGDGVRFSIFEPE
ncbi:MAG: Fe-S cluster assembly protein HesB [Solirubrobacteraceae bacterium]